MGKEALLAWENNLFTVTMLLYFAAMILFFASEAASFVNGEIGDVDGGLVLD